MNVIILHGRADNKKDNPAGHWMPWIKNKLSEKGIDTFIPLMSKPWVPNYKNWKKEFDNLDINEDSVLIGHSCGCAFLVRWLGETKKKVKKLILVAPWKIAESQDENEFYSYEINEHVKDNIKNVIIFTSDDEEENGKRSVKIFHKFLGGEIIELNNHGHFTLGDMKTEEFPELIDKILE
jgi:predicted alpha/beta hydrolase family esterase